MKKSLCLLSAFLIVLTLTACNRLRKDYKEELLNAMNSKVPFVSSDSKNVYLKDYQIPDLNEKYDFSPFEYTFVDFDNDEIKELVVKDEKQNYYQIFHYDKKFRSIYGYTVGVRSLIELKTDGTFMQSSGAGISSINKLHFENGKIVFDELAFQNDYENQYKIDGEFVKKKDINAYFNKWGVSTDSKWIKIK